jgi:flagellin
MGLAINNNVASLNAQNNLTKTNNMLSSSLEKLSTGLKINRGADGPAALVISEQQRAQIAGLRTAIDNTNKAVALVQTGEGALDEMNKLLNKVRSLAVDSANSGVNDAGAQAANQAEITNILGTIDRIAGTTKFGTKNLFDGSAGVSGTTSDTDVTFLRGTVDSVAGSYAVDVTTAGEKANVEAGTAQSANLAADENLNVNGVQIKLTAGMSQSQVVDKINEYSNQTGVKADTGGTGGATRLMSTNYGSAATVTVISDTTDGGGGDTSGIGTTALTDTGVDVAGTINGVAATGKGNVLTATSGAAKGVSVSFAASAAGAADTVTGAQGDVNVVNNALTFQVGANAGETVKVSFDKLNTANLGVGGSDLFANLGAITTANGGEALKAIDKAIADVTELRGRLGAFQSNTLESTANNLRNTLENTTAAESVIRDTDFASEIANFTKFQTQMQAGSTVLGNANQITQLVAGLLR